MCLRNCRARYSGSLLTSGQQASAKASSSSTEVCCVCPRSYARPACPERFPGYLAEHEVATCGSRPPTFRYDGQAPSQTPIRRSRRSLQCGEVLSHVLLVQAVVGLVYPAYEANIGVRRQPQPQLHVRGMGQSRVKAAHTLQERCAHDDLRRRDGVLPLTEEALEPPRARPDRPAAHSRPGRRQWRAVRDPQCMSINESDAGVGVQQIPGAPQGSGSEPIICRHQSAIVTIGPLEQALVERRDVPFIDRVDGHLHARVASRDLPSHISAVIRRGIVDDEHPHIDALLVIQHAGDGVLKEVTVLVTRDDDAD